MRNVLGWANREWNCQTHASRSVVAALDCPTDGCGVFMSRKQTKLFLIDGTPGGLTTRTSPTGQATSYPRVVRTLGIFLTPDALKPAVTAAVAAGIPVVAFNSGINQWRDMGGLEYFGQDETLAGESAGKASPPEAPRTSSV